MSSVRDRDGGSGCGGVELAAVDDGSGGGSVDRNGGSGCGGVELVAVTIAVVVDPLTETPAGGVLESS